MEVRPGNGNEPSLGLAIDVGTTTIVVYLVDMADGSVLAATSGHNRQAACGDDVIDLISELLSVGIIDCSGRFAGDRNHDRIRKVRDEWAYVLVPADRTPAGEDIVFTETDARNLV